MSVHSPVQKALPTRHRQKYSAARAFFLTVLVISAIVILSLRKQRINQIDIDGAHHALSSRDHLEITDRQLRGSSGELVQGGQEVRLTLFEENPQKDCHRAHNLLQSAGSSIPSRTNALSSAPTAQTKKQVSSPTYNCTTASCTRLGLSPSFS